VPVLDNVNPFKFSAVVPGLNEVVPKSNVLNQLAVVNVPTLAPVVNVKFGALDVVPPAVLPKTNVLVLLIAATVNPPVPVYVNPVAVAILNTVVAAVVCVRLISERYGLILLLVGRLPLVVVELYVELSVR